MRKDHSQYSSQINNKDSYENNKVPKVWYCQRPLNAKYDEANDKYTGIVHVEIVV